MFPPTSPSPKTLFALASTINSGDTRRKRPTQQTESWAFTRGFSLWIVARP